MIRLTADTIDTLTPDQMATLIGDLKIPPVTVNEARAVGCSVAVMAGETIKLVGIGVAEIVITDTGNLIQVDLTPTGDTLADMDELGQSDAAEIIVQDLLNTASGRRAN